MKIRIEYIILGLVVVALSLYLVFRNRDRVNYEMPSLADISAKDPDGIEVTKKNQTIKLAKSNAVWKLLPEGYRADADRVTQMLDEIVNFSIADLVSVSKNYGRYELEKDSRIRVSISKAGEVIRQFDIGKRAGLYQHVFVKIQEDERIFQAKGNFHTAFGQERQDMRDKLILSFEAAAASKIHLSVGAKNIELVKTVVAANPDKQTGTDKDSSSAGQSTINEPEIKWQLPDGTEWDPDLVDKLLEVLSDLRCLSFTETGTEMTTEYLAVTITADKEHKLQVFAKQGDDFPSASTGNEFPFILSNYWVEKIVDFAEGKTE